MSSIQRLPIRSWKYRTQACRDQERNRLQLAKPARQYENATPADVDYDIPGFGVLQYYTKYQTAIYEHNILI